MNLLKTMNSPTNLPTLPFGRHLHNTCPDQSHHQWKIRNTWNTFTAYWHWLKEQDQGRLVLVKIGAFYEAFHQDADILHVHKECLYMKGHIAHTGFPITVWDKYKQMLDDKGFTYCIIDKDKVFQLRYLVTSWPDTIHHTASK